jgi:hypothetical protein
MNTAAFTITSDAITKSPILATNLVIFKSIHFEVSFAHGILLLKSIIRNNINRIATKISLVVSIPKLTWKSQLEVSIFINDNMATHRNRYMKFLILGTETSIASSLGDSFFIIR